MRIGMFTHLQHCCFPPLVVLCLAQWSPHNALIPSFLWVVPSLLSHPAPFQMMLAWMKSLTRLAPFRYAEMFNEAAIHHSSRQFSLKEFMELP